MAIDYTTMNVRQKLVKARLYFLNRKVKKSGKNMQLEFKYFELEDIVPTATRIFSQVGLISDIEITDSSATMRIYNTDSFEEEPLVFSIPYRENDPIISKQGKVVTNKLQTLGASITYIRRYLWMTVLDITEPDEVDAKLGSEPEEETQEEIIPPNEEKAEKAKAETKERKAPATSDDRKKAKIKLTNKDGNADELQIKALKEACKTLMGLDESQEEFVQSIAEATGGMTNIPREKCEALIKKIGEMIAEYKE